LASLVLNNARLLEHAEEASRLKSDFLATMSHELRSPLHVIMGYTDLLLEGDFGSLTPEQQQIIRRVDRSARNLLDPIIAMLDVSRLEAGRLPVQVDVVELPALIVELQQEMEEDGREKAGVRLEWRIAPELPVLHTDKTKVKIVLKNLLQNGVKYTDAGSVTLTVAPHEHGVEFAVSDTGIGIPADVMPIIFDIFRQGDSSTTRRHEGIGLGLYIVKRLLELLEGTVTVESEVGRGSTFRVWVPTDAT
jgi:signal transduction histidine kinase